MFGCDECLERFVITAAKICGHFDYRVVLAALAKRNGGELRISELDIDEISPVDTLNQYHDRAHGDFVYQYREAT
jgi:hypothetical protein